MNPEHITDWYKRDKIVGWITVWIADNVYEIKSRVVSMFVYTAADTPICIDTGLSEDSVARGFDALGFTPERVIRFSHAY